MAAYSFLSAIFSFGNSLFNICTSSISIFKTAFKNAININPNYTLAYFNLARAYQAIGDKSSAAEYYQMTMDLNKITEELSDKDIRQRLYGLFE